LDLKGRKWREAGGEEEEEVHNLHASRNIIRVIKSKSMRWAVHVPRMEEIRNAHNILGGKSEGKRLLGKAKRKLEDNIRIYLREQNETMWTGSVWPWTGNRGDSCEYGFHKRREIS
jgi:hypothetical protein